MIVDDVKVVADDVGDVDDTEDVSDAVDGDTW